MRAARLPLLETLSILPRYGAIWYLPLPRTNERGAPVYPAPTRFPLGQPSCDARTLAARKDFCGRRGEWASETLHNSRHISAYLQRDQPEPLSGWRSHQNLIFPRALNSEGSRQS